MHKFLSVKKTVFTDKTLGNVCSLQNDDQKHADHDARYALQDIRGNAERRRDKAISADRCFKKIIAENHEKLADDSTCDICHRLMLFQQAHHDVSDDASKKRGQTLADAMTP